MADYKVQNRHSGEIVYAYTADEAVDWQDYPFTDFNHIPQADVPIVAPTRRVTKLEFVGRLGDDYIPLLVAAKSNVAIEAFMKMIDWATPEADGTSLDLSDARIIVALAQLEQAGAIGSGRAAEILA